MSKLSDTIGQFTVIPNSVIELWPEIGINAFCLFVCLRYHSNAKSLSFPSYEKISEETGLGNRAIARAIRILEKFDLLERKRRFANSTIYILKSPPITVKMTGMEDDPLLSNRECITVNLTGSLLSQRETNQIQLTRSIGNDPLFDEPFPEEKPASRRTDAKKKGDLLDGILAHAGKKADPVLDYPTDVQPALRMFFELWRVPIPAKPLPKSKSTEYSDWIQGLRELIHIGGEQFGEALRNVHKNWNNNPFTVSRPGALIKTMRAEIGILEQRKVMINPEPINPEPARKIVPVPPRSANLSKGLAQ